MSISELKKNPKLLSTKKDLQETERQPLASSDTNNLKTAFTLKIFWL